MDSDLKLERKWNEVPEIERSASISVRDEPLRLFALTPPTHDNNYCMFWQAFSRTQKPVEREAKKDYYIIIIIFVIIVKAHVLLLFV